MDNRDFQIIQKIIGYCDEISETMKYFDDSFSSFDNNFIYRNACSMSVMQIGELTIRLSDEFKDKYSAIPWRQIRGLRNIFAHEYERITRVELFETITSDIPALKQFCETIIQQYEKEKSLATQKNVPSIDEDEPER